MARWASGSRERLAEAALRLFAAQGFESTTVAQIAQEAGLTERTFFRYFADKREVLFSEQGSFESLFLEGLTKVPSDGATTPLALIAGAISRAASFFPEERRSWSRTRSNVLAANGALMEREVHKMSALAATLTEALKDHGVEPTTAAFAADAGVSVFRRSFAAWIAEGEKRSFLEIVDGNWRVLRQLLASEPTDT